MSDNTNGSGKKYGFLPQPIGIKHVYCNRSKGGLWYVVEDGKEINLEARSFRSVKGGLKGLTLHEAERGGKSTWKLGLILEGDDDQIYRFETGVGSVFCRGMLFAIASMTPEQIEGEIGLNPTPADPAKMDSAYAKSILYCNMFVNGVEVGSYPGGMDVDWQQLAQQALSLANRCNYPIENVPESYVFQSEDGQKKPATGKQWEPATRGMHKPAQTQQPTRPNGQNTRSGVTYPNAPLKSQPAASQSQSVEAMEILARETQAASDRIAAQAEREAADRRAKALSTAYNSLLYKIDKNYKLNGLEIDKERLMKAVERGAVSTFEDLTTYRKHQIVCNLGKQLILLKQPKLTPEQIEEGQEQIDHPAIAVIDSLLMATPLNEEVFNTIDATMDSAFSDLMPF